MYIIYACVKVNKHLYTYVIMYVCMYEDKINYYKPQINAL